MKNFTALFFTVFVLIGIASSVLFAQSVIDDRAWSRMVLDQNVPVKTETSSDWSPAEQINRYYDMGAGIVVGPNFRPHPGTNTTQSEMSVDVHPTNQNIIFGSANATNWPVTVLYGTGVYWSLDGAASWTGFDNPPFGGNGGDPASAIGPDGRFYEAYLTNSYALGLAVSTNNGTNWTTSLAYSTPSQDKEHVMVDKTLSSPYVNYVYYTWSDLNAGNAALVYSTNFGANWSAYKNLSTGLGGSFYQGPNVQTGPNGEAYVAYAIYDADWTDGEDGIGFSKSIDGGATWTNMRIYDVENFGIRGYLTAKSSIRVNSFPSMAVDRSGGPNNGTIYVCWPQEDVSPAGTDPDIVLTKSTDGGATWSPLIRVNDDAMNNGKDQYFPWCTVDQSTGQLMLVFYDSRDVPNSQAEVFMARSLDGGNTFENFKVSDQVFSPTPIPGLAGGYSGDYIGVAALNDVAYPFWTDNRTGNFQGWMAVVTFGPPCPVDPPANPNPANGATDVSINLSSISWTNGAGATQCEVWFGEAGNMVMVYDGALVTSWSIPSTLSYFTDYNWRIVGKNDTCSVSGSLWSFKTEQDPNIQCLSTTVYPQGANYWTGTTDGSNKTDVSEVRGLNIEDGWFTFDISSIPDNAIIDSIRFYGYVNSTDWPYWSATPLPGLNPLTATASQLKTAIEANSAQGVAYVYQNESSSYTTGWHNYIMEANANADLEAALTQDWFAMGMDSRDNSTSYWINFDGWAQTNVPYLVVSYCYSVPVELTTFTAHSANDAVELNWITATETNNQGFEVERKSGNGEFVKIGFVEGNGTTTETQAYSYMDSKLAAGNYTYRLKQIDFDGSFEYSSEVNVDVALPLEYALEQNYPNPFNPSTTIKYSLPEDGFVKLAVYNMLGEEVATIVNNVQKAGRYEVEFNAANLSSGVYVYRIESGSFTASKKLMLMK